MTQRTCRFQGCFKRLNSTADICPSCAIKERRRKNRASRKISVISRGVQSTFQDVEYGLFIGMDKPTLPYGGSEQS